MSLIEKITRVFSCAKIASMAASESVNPTDYQTQVSEQIIRFGIKGNPFTFGPTFIQERWGEKPLWGISFEDRTTLPL